MALQMFNKIRMQSEWNTAMLFDGVFYDATPAAAEVEDGACVSIKDPVLNALYDGNYGHPYDGSYPGPAIKDLNANKITAYDGADDLVGFIDFVGVAGQEVQGNLWKIGDKIAGIKVPAEWHTRVRIPQVGDEFYLGAGNFDAQPTTAEIAAGCFAAPEAGKTTLKKGTSKAASGLCVKVLDERTMIFGTVNGKADEKMYRVRVIQK